MEWPPISPDLNPIEHVWDMFSKRIRSLVLAPGALDELRRAILEQWAVIPQENVVELVDSILRRINADIQVRGGNTH